MGRNNLHCKDWVMDIHCGGECQKIPGNPHRGLILDLAQEERQLLWDCKNVLLELLNKVIENN